MRGGGWRIYSVLISLALLAVIVAARLDIPPRHEITLAGSRFPHLALRPLHDIPLLTDAHLRRGHFTLVNLFASWCVPCRAEAPQLAALRARGVDVAGIAVRDMPGDTAAFLRRGNPFGAVGLDPRGEVQAELGSSGIPETWVVDGDGIVRDRFRGDLHAADLPRVLAAAGAAR